jgi:hypothetical protein
LNLPGRRPRKWSPTRRAGGRHTCRDRNDALRCYLSSFVTVTAASVPRGVSASERGGGRLGVLSSARLPTQATVTLPLRELVLWPFGGPSRVAVTFKFSDASARAAAASLSWRLQAGAENRHGLVSARRANWSDLRGLAEPGATCQWLKGFRCLTRTMGRLGADAPRVT